MAVAVLVVLLIVGRPLLIVPGTVSLPIVRTMAIFFFVVVLVTFAALLIGGTVLFIGRIPSRLVGLGRR